MKKPIFIILINLLLLYSCEYNLDEQNLVEINKPSNTHDFSLSLSTNEDTIGVFDNAEFTYDLNTFGLEILGGYVILANDTLRKIYSNNGSFQINPDNYNPGIYNLKLLLFTHSGTGSIADISGAEGYVVEKEWTLLIDSRPAPELKLNHSITPEGYLKLTWDKCDQYNFYKYELIGSINTRNIEKVIYDPDSTFYTDSFYIGSSCSFRVKCYVNSEENSVTWSESLKLDEHYPKLHYEDIGIDSLRIFWEKSPYNCKFKLERIDTYPYITIIDFGLDTSIIIQQPGFGTRSRFKLYTFPMQINEYDYKFVEYDFSDYYQGQYISAYGSYAYNIIDKKVYFNDYNDLLSYDISSFNQTNYVTINDLSYKGSLACPTNSSKVAAMAGFGTSGDIYIFNDNSLQNPDTIPFDMGYPLVSVDHFFLTDNDIIAYAFENKYQLINANTKEILGTLQISDYPYYSNWACFSTSKDGKYMCYVTMNGIYLYNIESGNFNMLYTDTRSYRSVLFDKNNPEIFYLTLQGNNILEERNASDFSLINSYNLPTNSEVIRNIDPETGNMLLTDYEFIYLMDLNSSELLIKIPSSDYEPVIFSNRLFAYHGYTLNLTGLF